MASNLDSFYSHVVQDVILNVRADFEMEGLDESVLDELLSLWEMKLKNANVLPADYERLPLASAPAAPDLNLNPVEEEGTVDPSNLQGRGWTPNEENFLESLLSTPQLGTMNTPRHVHTSTGSTPLFSLSEQQGNFGHSESRQLEDRTGRPTPFMGLPFMSRQSLLPDINVVYDASRHEVYGYSLHELPEIKDYMGVSSFNKRKRDFISPFLQRDGAADIISPLCSRSKDPCKERRLVQLDGTDDGINDNYDDHITEEDYNLPGEVDAPADGDKKPVKGEGADSDSSEPPLNEDDDIDADALSEEDEASKTNNLVVAQFEKVTKVKGKWKCILKDGIMHLKEKDFLFSKANGEFDFF